MHFHSLRSFVFLACLFAGASFEPFSCVMTFSNNCFNYDFAPTNQEDKARVTSLVFSQPTSTANVTFLTLMGPKMKYFPHNLFQHLVSLEVIYVVHADSKMSAPKNGHFLLAKRLQQLVVNNQIFGELGSRVFSGASNIRSIRLDNNEITSLDKDTFSDLEHLEQLTLSSNQIKSLPQKVFRPLKGLLELDFTSNLLSAIPKKLFDNNPNLELINFSHNRLMSISQFRMFQKTSYKFLDGLCINQAFTKTSRFNAYTSENCYIDEDAFEMCEKYRSQVGIFDFTFRTTRKILTANLKDKFHLNSRMRSIRYVRTKICCLSSRVS